MATENDLRARLISNPEDPARFQVYADLLTEIGDERGELISVQLLLENTPDDAELEAREAKLLAAHEPEWLGPLAFINPKHLGITWRRGFLSQVRVGPPLELSESPDFDRVAVLEALLELPCADLLRGLTITPTGVEHPEPFQDCIEALATAHVPRTLESLTFDRGGFWDLSKTYLGDLSPAYRRLQHLRSLKLHLGSFELGAISLPRLRSLELITGGLTADNVRSIVQARWPELARLVLYVGQTDNDFGCDVRLEDLVSVLEGPNFERVTHLALANSSLSNELVPALVNSPLLPRLETLDLSHGTFSETGARALLANRNAFAHLEQLDLSRSFVPPELVTELQTLGPRVNLDEQHPTRGAQRSVSLGE
jgi:uncharacterized protein (TIGR02996 family)